MVIGVVSFHPGFEVTGFPIPVGPTGFVPLAIGKGIPGRLPVAIGLVPVVVGAGLKRALISLARGLATPWPAKRAPIRATERMIVVLDSDN